MVGDEAICRMRKSAQYRRVLLGARLGISAMLAAVVAVFISGSRFAVPATGLAVTLGVGSLVIYVPAATRLDRFISGEVKGKPNRIGLRLKVLASLIHDVFGFRRLH
jgi:hypothetical protein